MDPASGIGDLTAYLDAYREAYDLPALAAALVDTGGIVAIGAAGVRRGDSSAAVSTADHWHIGSNAKSMTATLAALLVEEGVLRWETTLAEALPALRDSMDPAWGGVTLEQLLTHRGGAPASVMEDHPELWSTLLRNEEPAPALRRMLTAELTTAPPASPPGEVYAYSNAGYAMAAAMIEAVTDRPWETLMRERVFAPLGMSSAGFGAPGDAARLDQPRGHDDRGRPVEPGPGADNPPAIGPAGTVHLSIQDWATYIRFHLRGSAGRGELLDSATFARLHRAVGDPPYAMGWEVTDEAGPGVRVLKHTGSNTVWYAMVWAPLENGFGVVVVTNQGGDRAREAVDQALWNIALDHLQRPPVHRPSTAPRFESVTDAAPVLDLARARGVAWGDFDRDGDPDLFVTRATYDPSVPPQGNVLYRNDRDGGFRRVDGEPTTDRDGDAEGAVWIDVDNDGDLDLHVVGRSGTGSVLYENTGGTLTRRQEDPMGGQIRSASMACWADVDADGRLDGFVVGYGGEANALFRNAGSWRFERVTLPEGAAGSGEGRACAWGDLDGDGLPELVVATARRPNLLLRNRGRFELVLDTTTALHRDTAYGYGLSWTDMNGDGLRDLFVANFDGPNTLHTGTREGGLEPSPWGERLSSPASKGHAWGDFDLDGREDLYLGSGTPAPGMLNRLYLSHGLDGFRLEADGEWATHADTSAAVAAADYDLDGDLDLFVANWGSLSSTSRLYRNRTSPGSWVRVGLEGVRSNRMGIGARVSVLAATHGEPRWLYRWLDATTGYAGQNEPILHFGLGTATGVDSLVVHWPSGVVDRHGPGPARVVYRIREGGSITRTGQPS